MIPGETQALTAWTGQSQQVGGDLLVKSRLYNAVLHDAVKKSGLTQAQYAQHADITLGTLGGLLSLRESPWLRNGEPRKNAQALVNYTEIPFDKLFPKSLYALRRMVPSEHLQKRYVSAQLVPLIEARNVAVLENPSTIYDRTEAEKVIREVLYELTPRQEKIIKLRFGIGERQSTLQEVAEIFGVHRETIRVIEAKALRRLRNPKNARKLEMFTEDSHAQKESPLSM